MNKAFTKSWFADLESKLRAMGLDSDDKSFDEIKENLQNRKILSPDEFASTVVYVILAGGFRQKTAKEYHKILMAQLPNNPTFNDLFNTFKNDKKIRAIMRVWENRDDFCAGYYRCDTLAAKIDYLKTLPHIGNITANHLARNLGEDMVKYDIWIQRLGALYSANPALRHMVDNGNLQPEIQRACDEMFDCMVRETGLPRGYIDVVLFRACQNHLIDLNIK